MSVTRRLKRDNAQGETDILYICLYLVRACVQGHEPSRSLMTSMQRSSIPRRVVTTPNGSCTLDEVILRSLASV